MLEISPPQYTPWGSIQHRTVLKPNGIWFCSTASHGGCYVARELNAEIPAYARNSSGWYEEDCEWAIVAFFFPDAFGEHDRHSATSVVRACFPDIFWAAISHLLLR